MSLSVPGLRTLCMRQIIGPALPASSRVQVGKQLAGMQGALNGTKRHRGRRAATAMEFAIVVVPFMSLLFAILGAGLDAFYQMTFDEAVRNAARQIQIAGPAATSGGNFVAAVCSEFGVMAPNCATSISYNVQSSSVTAGFAAITPVTLSGSGQLSNGFFLAASGAQNVNVVVQAAYKLPFIIPFFASSITGTGTTSILASTSVRIEPY